MDSSLLIIGIVILLVVVLLSIPRRVSGYSHDRQLARRQSEQMTRAEHDTFTEEEILTLGVDIRSPHARNQIKMGKWVEERNLGPQAQTARYYRQMQQHNSLDSGDDVVDAEVVDVPKFLKPGRRPLLGERSERSKKLLGG